MDEPGCKHLEDISGIISFHTSYPARQLLRGDIPGLMATRDQNQALCLCNASNRLNSFLIYSPAGVRA